MKQDKIITTITLTHAELAGSQQALQRLSTLSLEPNTAYWIGKTLKKIAGKLSVVSKSLEKQRFDLIVSLGKKEMKDNPSGVVGDPQVPTGNYQVLPENEEKFAVMWQAILDSTVELEILPIDIGMLGDNKITPGDASALDWLLVCAEKA